MFSPSPHPDCTPANLRVSAQVPKAVSVEPIAVPPGRTSTVVVRGTQLTDSTSLWTNLHAKATRLGGEQHEEQPIASAFADGDPPAGTIVLEAEEYDRGTWGKRAPFILNIGGGNVNTAEWDVDIPAAGNFVLELNYASGGERPVKLSLNGTELTDNAAAGLTGGFGPDDGRWMPERILSLRKGGNTIRLERLGGTPHFDKLALVPTEAKATTVVSVQPTDRIAPYSIAVPADTVVGIRGLRIATAAGISNMLLYMVDDLPVAKEINGKTSSEEGQTLSLPIGVEGYCDATHADRYAFTVDAGEQVSFEAVAQRLGTKLDPVLKLFDEDGNEIAFADDTPGLSGDCSIRHRFEDAGNYFVTIQDAQMSGSSSYRYRLRIGNFPLLTTPIPATVQSGKSTTVSFSGRAVDGVTAEILATDSDEMMPVSATFPGGAASGFTQLGVSSHPQFVLTAQSSEMVTVPSGISGIFTEPGELHRCTIDLKKGQKISITDRSRAQGVPALMAMAITDESGKQLATMRRGGTSGKSLTWSAPQDGRFELLLSELTNRGGSEFGYHVAIENALSDFELIVEKDNSILPQNGYAILKVTANRQGYNGPIELSVKGADASRESAKVNNAIIAEKAKETRLKVYYPPGMQTGQTQAIEIVGTATIDERVVRRTARTVAAFHKTMPQTTYLPTGLDGLIAFSIGPEIPDFFGLSLDGGEILFPRLVGEVYFTVRVKDREKGFKDMVNIRVEGFPEGFSADGGDRAVSRSDNNEYRFQLRGPSDIDRSSSHVRIFGEASFKGQTKEVELAKVPFRIIDPLIITATPTVPLQPGSRGKLKLKAKRFVPRAGGDKAEIAITFDAVPEGVKLPSSATISAGKNEVTVDFEIANDVKQAAPIQLTATTVVAEREVVVTTTLEMSK